MLRNPELRRCLLLCVPLVLLYHVLVYRAFAGRVTDEDLHEGY